MFNDTRPTPEEARRAEKILKRSSEHIKPTGEELNAAKTLMRMYLYGSRKGANGKRIPPRAFKIGAKTRRILSMGRMTRYSKGKLSGLPHYWSPYTRKELIERLAWYESTDDMNDRHVINCTVLRILGHMQAHNRALYDYNMDPKSWNDVQSSKRAQRRIEYEKAWIEGACDILSELGYYNLIEKDVMEYYKVATIGNVRGILAPGGGERPWIRKV